MSLADVLGQWGGVEVTAMEVYTDMFCLGTNEIQKNGEEKGLYKANPIGYWKTGSGKGHYRIMFDDTLRELQEADFAILNGISYFGRKNVQNHASKMYSIIFDIDGVTDRTLNAFLSGAFRVDAYPIPNYIALSGHGVHLYYVFEYGIPLYPNIKIQLKAFKYALIEKLWNEYTSKDEKKQFQGINQGFRPIGGKTKIDGVRVRAVRMHQHTFSLEQLGKYIPEKYRVDEDRLYPETQMTLAEAKKRYPEWYEKRILGKQNKGRWICKPDLYEWWKRQIYEGATYHHRYFSIMCLAIYGVKCGIDSKKVKQDALSFVPFLNAINPDEPFTNADCLSALECFDERYVTFPREDISVLSGIQIIPQIPRREKGKRLKQKDHLELARMARDIRQRVNGIKWTDNNGRPEKSKIVEEWQQQHPEGKKADCRRDTGLDPKTIRKWWNEYPNEETIEAIEEVRKLKANTDKMSYSSFNEVLEDLS